MYHFCFKIKMENIYTTVRPIYFLTKSIGLFPMSFDGPPRKGFFSTKWTDVVASCVSGVIPVCMIVFILTMEDIGTVSTSQFMSKMFFVSTFVGVCAIFVQFWLQIGRRHSIVHFLACMNNFDQRVRDWMWQVLCATFSILD